MTGWRERLHNLISRAANTELSWDDDADAMAAEIEAAVAERDKAVQLVGEMTQAQHRLERKVLMAEAAVAVAEAADLMERKHCYTETWPKFIEALIVYRRLREERP